MIRPAMVFGFTSTVKLEGGEIYELAVTSIPGIPVYYLQKQENKDIEQLYRDFIDFAIQHNCIPGWINVIVGNIEIPFYDPDDLIFSTPVKYTRHPNGFVYDST